MLVTIHCTLIYAALQPLAVAKLLAKVTAQEKPDLVILGKLVHFSRHGYLILGY